MQSVFADTFYWVALIHRKDASNPAVLEWSRHTATSTLLFTTEEVLTELLAFCSSNTELRTDAAKIVRSIRAPCVLCRRVMRAFLTVWPYMNLAPIKVIA